MEKSGPINIRKICFKLIPIYILKITTKSAGSKLSIVRKIKIENSGKWSKILEVTFPPTEEISILLTKILSIRVADFEVTLEGCKIRGVKP